MGDSDTERFAWPLTRRRFVAFAGSSALAGCLSVDFSEDGRVLEFVTARPPLTLDPLEVWDAGSAHIVNQVVEGLYEFDAQLNIDPDLAAGLPEVTRDGTRYVVTIDTDARFPGGEPVLAEDVVYSYTAPLESPSPPGTGLDVIESVTAIDERTVQFDLAYPYRAFPATMTWYVVPRERGTAAPAATDTTGEPTGLVGSGPFRFDERLPEGGIKLARWEDYWRQPQPAIEAVAFRPVTEGTKRVVTVRASEADVIDEVPPNVWQTLQELEEIRLVAGPSLAYYYLAFNCHAGPTADPDVREAIDYAVDLDTAVSETVSPIGERLYGPLPPHVADGWGFPTDDWAAIPHDRDIDKAATILQENDAVPENWEARLIVPPDDTRYQLCEIVADGIREAGYRARIDQLDWATFRDTYRSGDPEDYHAYCLGWIDTPDPDRYLHPLFGPEAPGRIDGTYYTQIADSIQTAREADTRTIRQSLYTSAIDTMLRDRAHLPLYTERQTLGMVDSVSDIGTHPLTGFVLVGDGFNVTITTDR